MKYFLLCLSALFFSASAMAQLEVIISGGFSGPYKQMLPEFEKTTGIKVVTKSGASQGSGPKTIKAQLAAGVTADVVILSREGLAELVEQNRILAGSDVDLAQAPLGLAIPSGNPRPNISTVKSFTDTFSTGKKDCYTWQHEWNLFSSRCISSPWHCVQDLSSGNGAGV
jgi:molybdate transport system substrate-binding protein